MKSFIQFLKHLLCILMGRCWHRGGLAYGWPTRRVDGKDWQACTECGHERVSPLQFNRNNRKDIPSDGEPA